jgi:hypothetical protein
MAAIPEGLAAVVAKAVGEHTDPEKAIECVHKAIRKSGEWSDFLIRYAASDLVYDARHKMNVAVRSSAGEYGGPAKVDLSSGAVASALSKSPHLSYFIAGRCLGDIAGEELSALADCEREKERTASFHVKLLNRLAATVPEGKAVRDCYSETKLRRLFEELNTRAKAKTKAA